MNVLALSFIQQSFGVTISFVQWFAFGFPFALISIPVGWFALVKIFHPENLSQAAIDAGISRASSLGKLSKSEIGGLAVMLVTLVLWILGSWIPALNTTVVSLIALGFMFLPGIEAISFDDYLADGPWGMMLLMMAVNVLVGALMVTGATAWLVETVMSPMTSWPLLVTMIALSIIACLLHNVIPAGPAVCGLITVPFATIIAGMGGSIAATCCMCAWWSAIALMLPLDGVPLLSYTSPRNYFSFGDMVKVGWLPSLVMVIITVTITPATAMLLGLA